VASLIGIKIREKLQLGAPMTIFYGTPVGNN
jgi:hypothetical protein